MPYRDFSASVLAIVNVGSIALAAVGAGWAFFYFGIYLFCGNLKNWGHQDFARNGVSQIAPAREMNETFADCRNYITYGAEDVPLFNSVAYFGDRYELVMQVPLRIESSTSGMRLHYPSFISMRFPKSAFRKPAKSAHPFRWIADSIPPNGRKSTKPAETSA